MHVEHVTDATRIHNSHEVSTSPTTLSQVSEPLPPEKLSVPVLPSKTSSLPRPTNVSSPPEPSRWWTTLDPLSTSADVDPSGRGGVAGQVQAQAALQDVGSAASGQHIVTVVAGDVVRVAVAGEVVYERRSDNVLDGGDRVALGVTTEAGALIQIYVDSRWGVLVRHHVLVAVPAVQGIGSFSAVKQILTILPEQQVVPGDAEVAVGDDSGQGRRGQSHVTG